MKPYLLILCSVFLSMQCMSDSYKIVQTSGGGPGILVSWTATITYRTSFGYASDEVKDGPFTVYRDGAGDEMYVWQNYVAGTDPTDPNSKLICKIDVIAGVPIITWSPNLNTNGTVRNSLGSLRWKTVANGHRQIRSMGFQSRGGHA